MGDISLGLEVKAVTADLVERARGFRPAVSEPRLAHAQDIVSYDWPTIAVSPGAWATSPAAGE